MKYYIDTDKKTITLHGECSLGELQSAITKNGGNERWVVIPSLIHEIDPNIFKEFYDYEFDDNQSYAI